MKGIFSKSGRLTLFMLRRDRVTSAIWILSLLLFTVALLPPLQGMFGSPEERDALITTLNAPAMAAFMGPLFNDSFGGVFSSLMLMWILITVGLMNIFLVIRHTRADEERGRSEVIRSLPVGRLSIFHATVITAVIVNAIMALLTGLGLAALGAAEGMSFTGSMLFGLTMLVFGLFMAAVTAVFAQLCVSSRAALGLSVMVLMITYMMRSMGDIGVELAGGIPLMSALSPLGILLYTRIYAGEQWWPVFVVLAFSALLFALAYALNRIRDMDQGFIPARPGRKAAAKSLLSPLGLSWRLLRTTLIVWVIASFALAASYGSIMGDVETFLLSNELYYTLIVVNPDMPLAESFASTITILLAICSVIPVLVASLKLRSEEKDNRIEQVLSQSVSRQRYFGGYIALGFIMSIITPFVSALGLYASAVSLMDNPISFSFCFNATMVYMPALWVMLGIAALLTGLAPKATAVSWAIMAYSIFSLFLGRAMNLPEWLTKITPFGYIPQLPMDDINWLTLSVLTVIAAALTVIGFITYRKRDVAW